MRMTISEHARLGLHRGGIADFVEEEVPLCAISKGHFAAFFAR